MDIVHDIWISEKQYEEAPVKICVVGESHYIGDGDDSTELTRDIVRAAIDAKKWLLFFLAVQYAFEETSSSFWEKVIFLNYVPVIVGKDENGQSKRRKMLKHDAQLRMKKVLLTYKPDKVFVFSNLVWRNFIKTDREVIGKSTYFIDKESKEGEWDFLTLAAPAHYPVEEHKCEVYGLRHPSRYSSKRVEQLRKLVGLALSGNRSEEPAWRFPAGDGA